MINESQLNHELISLYEKKTIPTKLIVNSENKNYLQELQRKCLNYFEKEKYYLTCLGNLLEFIIDDSEENYRIE